MKRVALAVAALSLLAIPAAQAQQSFGAGRPGVTRHGPPPSAHRPHARPSKHSQAHQNRWSRGQRYGDWRRHRAVTDYHRYGLRRPGHGQHWVRVGNDYLLVTAATGIIAAIAAASR